MLVHFETKESLGSNTNECDCHTCRILTTENVPDAAGKNSHTLMQNVYCQMRNVVYVLVCLKCDESVYVGETERNL